MFLSGVVEHRHPVIACSAGDVFENERETGGFVGFVEDVDLYILSTNIH